MGAAIHPSVNSLFRFAVLIVAPFNLFKFTIISLIVLLIYKRIRVILRTI
jgi:riboflavin transporter FmnP